MRPPPQRLYDEHLHALEMVLRLIDGVIDDTSPLIAREDDDPRQLERLKQAKVALSILAHCLRRAKEGRLPS